MKRYLWIMLVALSLIAFTSNAVHAQAAAKAAKDAKAGTSEKKEEKPATKKVTIPTYNYKTFEGARAASVAAGLWIYQNQFEAAFVIFKQSTFMNKESIDKMKTKAKTEYVEITKKFGASQGVDVIEETRKGEYLYRITLMDRRVVRPIFWELIYYKTKGQWVLSSLTYHQNITRAFRYD